MFRDLKENMFVLKRFLAVVVLVTGTAAGVPAQTVAERPPYQVELFMGADVNYRCTMLNEKVYDFLIYLTPAVKWHFGEDWLVSIQGALPIVNHYGEYYKYPKINIASVSRELNAGKHFFKFSGGIFSRERYGADAKWLWTATERFALEGQVGFTGYYSMSSVWTFSNMDRLTGTLTARYYLEKSDTEFRLGGGRYIYGDYGVRGEWYKHFSRFCSVGVFVQWGDKYGTYSNSSDPGLKTAHFGGGAKLIFMLPWQGNSSKKFRVRPVSNFRLTYDYWADNYGMRMYETDPEENERTGNFRRAGWGFGR